MRYYRGPSADVPSWLSTSVIVVTQLVTWAGYRDLRSVPPVKAQGRTVFGVSRDTGRQVLTGRGRVTVTLVSLLAS